MRALTRGIAAGAALLLLIAAPLPTTASAASGAPSLAERLEQKGHKPLSPYVVTERGANRFPLVADGKAAPLIVSKDDYAGVIRVVDDLQTDIKKVTGVEPVVSHDTIPAGSAPVIVGTLGKSPLVDRIVARGKLDVSGLRGKWETTIEQVVRDPLPGVREALLVVGSDQRGSIYGAYDLSKSIGVSPWSFWDDVPVAQHDELYVLPGRHTQGTPKVKYRGFFINDENPATGTWAPGYFGPGKAPGYPGGLNAAYYAKVFETMLRLKANYLWPAVWGRAFAEDDPANHATASFYGVVMGTSHEAPMMRGIEEWNRHPTGTGEWSFRRNPDAIKAYWRDGAERMREQNIEGVITLGMRGNGDVSLPDGDGIDLMSSIIDSQRQILRDTGLIDRPQVQTLYKEVQRYWDEGYRPPDDVTVVFCDDNWGNLRKLPDASQPARSGGYGMYYHFDYVGDGRNYKWADTINLTNTWEQLNLAYGKGVDRLWVVNVGDLKNEEVPTQFFLDYAWNPDAWPIERLGEWTGQFAAQNFGRALAPAIAELLDTYGFLQSRRKPELLNRRITLDPVTGEVVYNDQASPFSLTEYGEMDRVTQDWIALARRASAVREKVPAQWQDAFYQLVYYQIKDTAVVYELRRAQFRNIAYAAQGRAATNRLADTAERLFAEDQAMSDYYNNTLAGGKWKNWQLQPKIGYGNVERYGPNAGWQQPELNNVALPDEIYPHLKRIEVPSEASMGVADTRIPQLSPWQNQEPAFEIFNKGTTPFRYRITTGASWVHVTPASGVVNDQTRVVVTADWKRAPSGTSVVPLTVTGAGRSVVVQVPVSNPAGKPAGFLEADGYVAMEADHHSRKTGKWRLLPGIGKTGNGLTPLSESASLEYTMTLTSSGPVKVTAYLSPRNNVLPGDGLKYAVSIDGQTPQVVNITTATGANDTTMNRPWARNTSDNINRTTTTHVIDSPRRHTLKFTAVDPTVIVQRLIVDTGGVQDSYFGPPESRWVR
ncbi:glycosyl hydrolase 115 family protein [Actinoplanes bogorensis]|uniref:Glycosyl hydrolase 115 family protein n=1 Tax=Paractinoplanes bogorensis TaxID=1610840 RepID=A0ABS5YMG3_9ACTN|nr:glycosyl hydrolase 115 family protein [Actinoplanes bogorensis]MBU2664568.1 glycosyl hydrolase 115 family protein [Actinoplanes bogorensis]